MSIGVGITTRNRPECLEACLRHFREFGYGDKIVVIDDSSDVAEVNQAVIKSFDMPIIYKYSEKRLGISGAKNACLWELQDVDDVFLFDDDTWPAKKGWEDTWTLINRANSMGHSIYSVNCNEDKNNNHAIRAHVEKIATIGFGELEMFAFNNCFGVMLYFNRDCLNAIGGYDMSAENVYGFEHAQMSIRAAKAGFTQGHKYVSPSASSELIYSVDIAYNWLGEQPPLPVNWLPRFSSSVTKEEADGHKKNSKLMTVEQIFMPLENPLGD